MHVRWVLDGQLHVGVVLRNFGSIVILEDGDGRVHRVDAEDLLPPAENVVAIPPAFARPGRRVVFGRADGRVRRGRVLSTNFHAARVLVEGSGGAGGVWSVALRYLRPDGDAVRRTEHEILMDAARVYIRLARGPFRAPDGRPVRRKLERRLRDLEREAGRRLTEPEVMRYALWRSPIE